jgi:hypothetical protein
MIKKFILSVWSLKILTPIKYEKLGEILNRFCHKKKIDFLNIDTEGTEAVIFKNNNWKKFKLKIIFYEILNCDLEQTIKNEITIFLKSKGYKSFYKDVLN